MEGLELGSRLDDFLCYLTILLAHAGRLNFSNRMTFTEYYMVGWAATEDIDDMEDLIFSVSIDP